MKRTLAAMAALTLFAAPALADELAAQSVGGKPGSSINPSSDSAAKNWRTYESTGPSFYDDDEAVLILPGDDDDD